MVESGSLTYRPPGSKKYGSVGKPLDGVEFRFESDGEIIVRRERSLTKKYFQCAEGESERTFIDDGCVATGDIGKLDADGYLYLLGRKKELIITPGGYKIHPEIIEEELNSCPDVAQSVVLARPGAAQLVCVVVPGQFGSDEGRERIRKFAGALTSTKKTIPVGEVLFAEVPFSIENGMLRPNLKLDRRGIAAKFNI
jgi:long-chain acyl-CoA synthetase